MYIRPFISDDQDKVLHLMAGHPLQFPAFVMLRYPERWAAYLQAKDNRGSGYMVMAEGDETTLAHAGYIFNDEVSLYEIVGVVVHKDQKRRGIGKALIHAVCGKISECGGKRTILYTLGHADTQNTLAFYRQIGFEQTNEERDYFMPGFHRVTFEKALLA
ncbi:GNAT family N-acetyltransferase [Paenibacillus sp. MMS18-CY102]|uniref:GNAT family N-acetyltransferase n=1 Tax=Paenibacillus sp. MMS18-CY102 TaxID=2682849 RepID=UPI0013664847|nr:GNAT family N-acetyltransferase [Paenibacillus sp. MMS18-CY102]MWC30248.1 GNAT family N-acetyltransferase [Paenibacillus sp. MMS18-CY102]